MKTLFQIVGQVTISTRTDELRWKSHSFAANQLIWANGRGEAEAAFRKHTNDLYKLKPDDIKIDYLIQATEVLDAEKILC